MSPAAYLVLTVSVAAGAVIANRQMDHRRHQRLRRAAAKWRLHYSVSDQFRLSTRITELFPIPGAADLRIADLMYGIRGHRHSYIFTADFTTGLMHTNDRRRRVVHFSEPRERNSPTASRVELAPENLPLLEQYGYFAESPALAPPGGPAGDA